MHTPHIIIQSLLVLLLWTSIINHSDCLKLYFPTFDHKDGGNFQLSDKSGGINGGALQVTLDAKGANTADISGRIVYKKKFYLHRKHKIASFNSTFVLNITPDKGKGGEGVAFILTGDPNIPLNSSGQWLGLVNSTSNGSYLNNIVAIEFDTKKSFSEDLDDNHVGLDVNSVNSVNQTSLNRYGIRIASGNDTTVMVIYDGVARMVNVSVFNGSNPTLVMSQLLDLSQYLPNKVYVGFSGSTGDGTELNCVKSWYFNGDDVDSEITLWMFIVILILSLVLLICALGGGCLYCMKTRAKEEDDIKAKEKQKKEEDGIKVIETGLGPMKFKLKDLKSATDNFNPKNELGRGGFGVVYKGIWGNKTVVVKRTVNTAQAKQNLIAEVTAIGNLHHKNLVELLGWCYESGELLLVYEYMPNGSLDKFMEGDNGENLCWERRHSIICGVAQALDYLHHECSKRVLHRDIKASNIMLDIDFNARLGDFGLARMFNLGEKTHHSTKELVGTIGYMAPEIFHLGRTTAETDVFSFGILSLVVATGRTPGVQGEKDEKYATNIVDWVWEHYKLEMVDNVIDSKMKLGEDDKEEVKCMIVLGLACCHPNPYMRPSMRNVLQVLMGEANPPIVPLQKPVFMWPITNSSFDDDDDDDDDDTFYFESSLGDADHRIA